MTWWMVLIVIFSALVLLFLLGVPVAIAFLLIDIVGGYLLWNGTAGLQQLVLSIFDSVSLFTLLPVPLFIFMGEIMFRSGVVFKMFDVLGKWMGAIPGRLSLLAVGSGTLFAVLSGSSVASTALLGSLLAPEMDERGYKRTMSYGPILASAGLATMIPPSALGILLASLSSISVGQFLIAIILPGLLLAFTFVLYILLRCRLQPELAPIYDVQPVPVREKLWGALLYILPLGGIVVVVLGVILMGIATPTQSAAFGALSTLILSACYRRLNTKIFRESLSSSIQVSVMILLIMAGSTAFSQILSFTGATQGLVQVATSFDTVPLLLIIIIQLLLLVLGCFMEPLSIMMMTLPILMPIAQTLGWNPIWFGAIILLNMQMATATPPFGMDLFALKGILGERSGIDEIYNAIWPFILLNILVMAIMIAFPQITLWLPSMMQR